MNKLILLIIIGILQPTFSQNEIQFDFDIVGKWKAEDETGYAYFTFEEDGSAIIQLNDKILGGKEFKQNGMEFSLKYNIQNNTEPIELDLVFTELKSQRKLIWPCLIKVKNDNEIVFARGEDGKRPDNIISSDYAILKRIE